MRRVFDERWSRSLKPRTADVQTPTLHFEDVPWPISNNIGDVTPETLTKTNISSFLLFIPVDAKTSGKEIIRSALLKFHPDKFEPKILSRMRPEDVERTREAAGAVVRVLNDMAKEYR